MQLEYYSELLKTVDLAAAGRVDPSGIDIADLVSTAPGLLLDFSKFDREKLARIDADMQRDAGASPVCTSLSAEVGWRSLVFHILFTLHEASLATTEESRIFQNLLHKVADSEFLPSLVRSASANITSGAFAAQSLAIPAPINFLKAQLLSEDLLFAALLVFRFSATGTTAQNILPLCSDLEQVLAHLDSVPLSIVTYVHTNLSVALALFTLAYVVQVFRSADPGSRPDKVPPSNAARPSLTYGQIVPFSQLNITTRPVANVVRWLVVARSYLATGLTDEQYAEVLNSTANELYEECLLQHSRSYRDRMQTNRYNAGEIGRPTADMTPFGRSTNVDRPISYGYMDANTLQPNDSAIFDTYETPLSLEDRIVRALNGVTSRLVPVTGNHLVSQVMLSHNVVPPLSRFSEFVSVYASISCIKDSRTASHLHNTFAPVDLQGRGIDGAIDDDYDRRVIDAVSTDMLLDVLERLVIVDLSLSLSHDRVSDMTNHISAAYSNNLPGLSSFYREDLERSLPFACNFIGRVVGFIFSWMDPKVRRIREDDARNYYKLVGLIVNTVNDREIADVRAAHKAADKRSSRRANSPSSALMHPLSPKKNTTLTSSMHYVSDDMPPQLTFHNAQIFLYLACVLSLGGDDALSGLDVEGIASIVISYALSEVQSPYELYACYSLLVALAGSPRGKIIANDLVSRSAETFARLHSPYSNAVCQRALTLGAAYSDNSESSMTGQNVTAALADLFNTQRKSYSRLFTAGSLSTYNVTFSATNTTIEDDVLTRMFGYACPLNTFHLNLAVYRYLGCRVDSFLRKDLVKVFSTADEASPYLTMDANVYTNPRSIISATDIIHLRLSEGVVEYAHDEASSTSAPGPSTKILEYPYALQHITQDEIASLLYRLTVSPFETAPSEAEVAHAAKEHRKSPQEYAKKQNPISRYFLLESLLDLLGSLTLNPSNIAQISFLVLRMFSDNSLVPTEKIHVPILGKAFSLLRSAIATENIFADTQLVINNGGIQKFYESQDQYTADDIQSILQADTNLASNAQTVVSVVVDCLFGTTQQEPVVQALDLIQDGTSNRSNNRSVRSILERMRNFVAKTVMQYGANKASIIFCDAMDQLSLDLTRGFPATPLGNGTSIPSGTQMDDTFTYYQDGRGSFDLSLAASSSLSRGHATQYITQSRAPLQFRSNRLLPRSAARRGYSDPGLSIPDVPVDAHLLASSEGGCEAILCVQEYLSSNWALVSPFRVATVNNFVCNILTNLHSIIDRFDGNEEMNAIQLAGSHQGYITLRNYSLESSKVLTYILQLILLITRPCVGYSMATIMSRHNLINPHTCLINSSLSKVLLEHIASNLDFVTFLTKFISQSLISCLYKNKYIVRPQEGSGGFVPLMITVYPRTEIFMRVAIGFLCRILVFAIANDSGIAFLGTDGQLLTIVSASDLCSSMLNVQLPVPQFVDIPGVYDTSVFEKAAQGQSQRLGAPSQIPDLAGLISGDNVGKFTVVQLYNSETRVLESKIIVHVGSASFTSLLFCIYDVLSSFDLVSVATSLLILQRTSLGPKKFKDSLTVSYNIRDILARVRHAFLLRTRISELFLDVILQGDNTTLCGDRQLAAGTIDLSRMLSTGRGTSMSPYHQNEANDIMAIADLFLFGAEDTRTKQSVSMLRVDHYTGVYHSLYAFLGENEHHLSFAPALSEGCFSLLSRYLECIFDDNVHADMQENAGNMIKDIATSVSRARRQADSDSQTSFFLDILRKSSESLRSVLLAEQALHAEQPKHDAEPVILKDGEYPNDDFAEYMLSLKREHAANHKIETVFAVAAGIKCFAAYLYTVLRMPEILTETEKAQIMTELVGAITAAAFFPNSLMNELSIICEILLDERNTGSAAFQSITLSLQEERSLTKVSALSPNGLDFLFRKLFTPDDHNAGDLLTFASSDADTVADTPQSENERQAMALSRHREHNKAFEKYSLVDLDEQNGSYFSVLCKILFQAMVTNQKPAISSFDKKILSKCIGNASIKNTREIKFITESSLAELLLVSNCDEASSNRVMCTARRLNDFVSLSEASSMALHALFQLITEFFTDAYSGYGYMKPQGDSASLPVFSDTIFGKTISLSLLVNSHVCATLQPLVYYAYTKDSILLNSSHALFSDVFNLTIQTATILKDIVGSCSVSEVYLEPVVLARWLYSCARCFSRIDLPTTSASILRIHFTAVSSLLQCIYHMSGFVQQSGTFIYDFIRAFDELPGFKAYLRSMFTLACLYVTEYVAPETMRNSATIQAATVLVVAGVEFYDMILMHVTSDPQDNGSQDTTVYEDGYPNFSSGGYNKQLCEYTVRSIEEFLQVTLRPLFQAVVQAGNILFRSATDTFTEECNPVVRTLMQSSLQKSASFINRASKLQTTATLGMGRNDFPDASAVGSDDQTDGDQLFIGVTECLLVRNLLLCLSRLVTLENKVQFARSWVYCEDTPTIDSCAQETVSSLDYPLETLILNQKINIPRDSASARRLLLSSHTGWSTLFDHLYVKSQQTFSSITAESVNELAQSKVVSDTEFFQFLEGVRIPGEIVSQNSYVLFAENNLYRLHLLALSFLTLTASLFACTTSGVGGSEGSKEYNASASFADAFIAPCAHGLFSQTLFVINQLKGTVVEGLIAPVFNVLPPLGGVLMCETAAMLELLRYGSIGDSTVEAVAEFLREISGALGYFAPNNNLHIGKRISKPMQNDGHIRRSIITVERTGQTLYIPIPLSCCLTTLMSGVGLLVDSLVRDMAVSRSGTTDAIMYATFPVFLDIISNINLKVIHTADLVEQRNTSLCIEQMLYCISFVLKPHLDRIMSDFSDIRKVSLPSHGARNIEDILEGLLSELERTEDVVRTWDTDFVDPTIYGRCATSLRHILNAID